MDDRLLPTLFRPLGPALDGGWQGEAPSELILASLGEGRWKGLWPCSTPSCAWDGSGPRTQGAGAQTLLAAQHGSKKPSLPTPLEDLVAARDPEL